MMHATAIVSTGSLKLKLALSTAALLTVTCLVLGWLFLLQQVQSVTAGLLDSGTLLTQHVARTSRHATQSSDTLSLARLIRETLAVPQVTYVAIVAPEHQVELGAGKEAWAQQFTRIGPSRQRFSLSGLILPKLADHHTVEPLISAFTLTGATPMLRPHLHLSTQELIGLCAGVEYPMVVDVTVPLPTTSSSIPPDPALGLTLEEGVESFGEPMSRGISHPPFVQIGLSTTSLQETIRHSARQIVLVTLALLILALLGGVLLAHRLITPLQALTSAARHIAAGTPAPPVLSQRHDEIGTLTQVFNQMVDTLHTREQDLRELTRTLETRVHTRTEELQAANAKLQELDRRKSLFVSTASHELRTPLTSIRLNLANLLDEVYGAVGPEQRDVLSRLETSLGRLQHLIEELLDLSRIEVGEITLRPKAVELSPVIAHVTDTLRALAKEKGITLSTEVEQDLPTITVDLEKVQQILTNLIHNAIKFSPSASAVRIAATANGHGTVQISVADRGIGIAPDDLDKIFIPFYRSPNPAAQAKGTGLGLTIAKHLVELHRGRLWVESRPGEGSTFAFTLPIS